MMAFETVFDDLPPALAARMRATVERREAQGLNVHFINAEGKRDRYSFRDHDRAERFRASLRRQGLTILEGTEQ